MIKFNKHTVYFSSFFIVAIIIFIINIFYNLDFSAKEIFMISVVYSTTIYSIFSVIFKFSIYNQCDPVFDEYAEIKNHATRIGMMLVTFIVSYLLTKDLFNF